MLKEIVKAAKAPVKARILPQGNGCGVRVSGRVRPSLCCEGFSGGSGLSVPPDVILRFREKIEKLEPDVYAVLRLEREERALQCSEAQVRQAGGGRWRRGSWAEFSAH